MQAQARDWFEVHEFPASIIGIRESGHEVDVWSYLVLGRELALLFDTGNGFVDIRGVVDAYATTPVLVVNSHAHWDHIGDDWRFERVWVHAAEAADVETGVANVRFRHWLEPEHFRRPLPVPFDPDSYAIPGAPVERRLQGGEQIELGGRTLSVIHTPGHSPGGIALYDEPSGALLSGDGVYAGELLVQLPGADPPTYRQTLVELAGMSGSVSVVYPSHYEAPLDAGILREAGEAAERVWAGATPSSVEDGLERYDCGRVSFVFQEGWRGR